MFGLERAGTTRLNDMNEVKFGSVGDKAIASHIRVKQHTGNISIGRDVVSPNS